MTDFDVQVVGDDDLPPGTDWALYERSDGVTIAFVKTLPLARHPVRTISECETAAEVSVGRHRRRLRARTFLRLLHRDTA
ncbi:MAG: hypothetical protein ACRDOJ_04510 [Nocardioidaceae bacterium]